MSRKKSKTRVKSQKAPTQEPLSRRQLMSRVAWGLGGAVVVVGGGTAFAMDFRAKLAEGDLTRVGQGMPTIVQIHDPQCSQCQALQRETRAALKGFDDDQYTFLVANITSVDGASFAARLGLPHVTLALFDKTGRHVHTVSGVTPRDELEATFRRELRMN